ncbi:MAG: hypothetical protein Tsb0034_14990 [Ekhidna sp.]
MAKEVLEEISAGASFTSDIERIRISWLDKAEVFGALVVHDDRDTLLYAEKVSVNYRLLHLLKGDFLNIQSVEMSNAKLNLVKENANTKLNLTQFINSLRKDSSRDKKGKPLKIEEIEVLDLNFSLLDKEKTKYPDRLDFSNMKFQVDGINLETLQIRNDTISGDLQQFVAAEEYSGFQIDNIETKFRLSATSLSLDDLEFSTPSSHVADSLEFFYNGLDDLGSFVDSVSFIFHFNNSRISKDDIRLITGVESLKSDLTLEGIFWGTVGDFNIEDARIGFGTSTYFKGGVSCYGLPEIHQAFILADITESHLLPKDLEPYIGELSQNLIRMGRIDFTGSFAGFVKDFVAKGDFFTDQGSVHSDINIKIPDDPSEMSYKGNLELDGVNIGEFFENELVQKVNMIASIQGKGIHRSNADFKLKAVVYDSELRGYTYDSVQVNGQFIEDFFDGSFSVKDMNCNLEGTAQIDLRSEKEIVDLSISIDHIDANRIKLTNRSISGSGIVKASIQDLDIDQFVSSVRLDSSYINLNDQKLVLDSVRFDAFFREDSSRVFDFYLPGISGRLEGKYKISDAINDLPIIYDGYLSKVSFAEDTISKPTSGEDYRLKLHVDISKQSVLDSLDLPLKLLSDLSFDFGFRQGKNSIVSLFAKSDSLEFKGNEMYNVTAELDGSKGTQSSNILTSFILKSSKQKVKGMPETQNLLLEGVWFDNEIDLTAQIEQEETETDINLGGNLFLFSDSLLLKVQPSSLNILGDEWKFNPRNKVVFRSDKTKISMLELRYQSETVTINGILGDSIETHVDIAVKQLNVNKANLLSNSNLNGELSGDFSLFRNTSAEPFRYQGNFSISELIYEGLLIGDLMGNSDWSPSNNHVYSEVTVAREDFKTIEVEGYYFPFEEQNQLDFNVSFDQASLQIANPFLGSFFSDVDGTASGRLEITGLVRSPSIVGDAVISGGAATFDYFNTRYRFDGPVVFEENTVRLEGFDIRDRRESDAFVTGTITHQAFSNFVTDLTIRASNFEFLNTTSIDNELYYGSAYGTGTISITGPLNDLTIDADVRTEAGTRLYIPVTESTSSTQEDYIQFVDFSDTTSYEVNTEDVGIKGLTLDFDIDVTPDAYCELIFDIKTGDIIRGRGRGNIKLRMNTDGEFNMFGPLEITEGAYNFTVPNFINKEFQVIPGSRITWYGDPYNATLDLEASYLQRASFEELKNPEDQISANLSDKVPLLVILTIDGGMLAPEIDFDIRLQNEGDADQNNTPLLAQIKNNEQELRKQVISLLFLKRFTPRQSFSLGGGGSIGSSVSEFLSSQVSYLVSQIDENLEVEVDLADLNDEAFNTFQLRFAYTFLDGRLKVSRGGNFGSGDETQESNLLDDIVGDWSVEYSLTKDGRLRAKVFRNSNQRLITSDGQQSQETGVSLRFVHSFDGLADLFKSQRAEGLRRRKEELEENSRTPDAGSY